MPAFMRLDVIERAGTNDAERPAGRTSAARSDYYKAMKLGREAR